MLKTVVQGNLSVRILKIFLTALITIASLYCETVATAQTTSSAPTNAAASNWKQVEEAMGRPGRYCPAM